MKIVLAFTCLALTISDCARCDTFGSGATAFNIDFVTIGNPGNVADTTGDPSSAGSVQYTYRMEKYEIPEQVIDSANALGGLGITKDTRGPDKPATSVSWNEAARFVNWLNVSTGSKPAYRFAFQPGEVGYDPNTNIQLWTPSDAGYDANNRYRNKLARYFLPSDDEWYKAAYYDPASDSYYDYPTASNSVPTSVASGTTSGTAVYNQSAATGPANIELDGGPSPYGTIGQGGNAREMIETDSDLVNDSGSSQRVYRGGCWVFGSFEMLSSNRSNFAPTLDYFLMGFRVASVISPVGDYDDNSAVNAADYVNWRKFAGTATEYSLWRTNFGQSVASGALSIQSVPEPSTHVLGVITLASLPTRRRRSALHYRA